MSKQIPESQDLKPPQENTNERKRTSSPDAPSYTAMLQELSYCDGKPVFPYVVSVAGHEDCCRDGGVSDGYRYTRAQIEKTFEEQLQGLVTTWHESCASTRVPFLVLSSLTKGADQIAAGVALKPEFQEQGVRVVAVLPTVCEFFREALVDDRFNKIKVPKDEKEKVKEDFDNLLRRIKTQNSKAPNDEYVFELPFVNIAVNGEFNKDEKLNKIAKELKKASSEGGKDFDTLFEQAVTRLADVNGPDQKPLDFQYDYLADFLANHSHFVFAFWDGLTQKGLAGTDKVVKYKLLGNQRYSSDSDYLTYPSVGLVAQIFTPRNENEEGNGITRQNEHGGVKGYDRSQAPFSLFPKGIPEDDVRPPVFLWSREELVDPDNCPKVPQQADMNASNVCRGLIAEKKYLTEVFKRLGKLNSYILDNYGDIKSGLAQSVEYLFQHGELTETAPSKPKLSKRLLGYLKLFVFQSRKPAPKKTRKKYSADQELIKALQQDPETKVLLDHYAAVDQLAMMFQGFTKTAIRRYILLTLCFVFVGGSISILGEVQPNDAASLNEAGGAFSKYFSSVFGGVFSKFVSSVFPQLSIAALLYCAILVGIVILYIKSHESEYHLAFHRCRCMAEALRVQIFWRMAGIGNSTSGYYHSHQTLKTDWLRTGLLGLDVLFKSPRANAPTYLGKIQEYWIKGQAEYFKNRSNERYAEAGSGKFFGVLLPIAFVFVAIQPIYSECVSIIYNDWGRFAAVCFAVVPSLILGWFTIYTLNDQMNRLKAEAERYERAQYPFARAAYFLSNRDLAENARKQILKQVGSEALTENADWYLAAGERELMLPR